MIVNTHDPRYRVLNTHTIIPVIDPYDHRFLTPSAHPSSVALVHHYERVRTQLNTTHLQDTNYTPPEETTLNPLLALLVSDDDPATEARVEDVSLVSLDLLLALDRALVKGWSQLHRTILGFLDVVTDEELLEVFMSSQPVREYLDGVFVLVTQGDDEDSRQLGPGQGMHMMLYPSLSSWDPFTELRKLSPEELASLLPETFAGADLVDDSCELQAGDGLEVVRETCRKLSLVLALPVLMARGLDEDKDVRDVPEDEDVPEVVVCDDGVVVLPDQWRCSECTMVNDKALRRCSVCNARGEHAPAAASPLMFSARARNPYDDRVEPLTLVERRRLAFFVARLGDLAALLELVLESALPEESRRYVCDVALLPLVRALLHRDYPPALANVTTQYDAGTRELDDALGVVFDRVGTVCAREWDCATFPSSVLLHTLCNRGAKLYACLGLRHPMPFLDRSDGELALWRKSTSEQIELGALEPSDVRVHVWDDVHGRFDPGVMETATATSCRSVPISSDDVLPHTPRCIARWRRELDEGSRLDVLDTVSKWYPSRVLARGGGAPAQDNVFISYDGWDDKKWAEWIDIESPRLARLGHVAVGTRFRSGRLHPKGTLPYLGDDLDGFVAWFRGHPIVHAPLPGSYYPRVGYYYPHRGVSASGVDGHWEFVRRVDDVFCDSALLVRFLNAFGAAGGFAPKTGSSRPLSYDPFQAYRAHDTPITEQQARAALRELWLMHDAIGSARFAMGVGFAGEFLFEWADRVKRLCFEVQDGCEACTAGSDLQQVVDRLLARTRTYLKRCSAEAAFRWRARTTFTRQCDLASVPLIPELRDIVFEYLNPQQEEEEAEDCL